MQFTTATPIDPKLRSDRDELANLVREWVCESCMRVTPGPPAKGLAGVICPKCNGMTMPKAFYEQRQLKSQLTAALARLEAAEKLVAKWRTEHALGGAHSLIERVIFRDCANDLEAALSSPTQEPDADAERMNGPKVSAGWQPIETAPKSVADGRMIHGIYILAFVPERPLQEDEASASPDSQICIVWWEPLMKNDKGGRGLWMSDTMCEVHPTQWLFRLDSLPEPPA